MTAEERSTLLKRAITTYGTRAQADMAVEEMAELTKAICKTRRAQPGPELAAPRASMTPSEDPAQQWPPARHTGSPRT